MTHRRTLAVILVTVISTLAAVAGWNALWSVLDGTSKTGDGPPASVLEFYQTVADAVAERGSGRITDVVAGVRSLDWPDGHEPVPSSVLEACGFYWLNLQVPDNGSVYLFRGDARGTPTYGVLGTTDGSDGWLEVYTPDGTLLGAARFDVGVVLWRDRDTVRRKIWDGALEPEFLEARKRRIEKSSQKPGHP